MKIVAYKLQDGDDPRQIIVFQREHIEESGKKDVRFLVWDRHSPKFGISNSNYSQMAGILVRDNKKLIQTFLGNIIRKGEAKTCYQYLGATEEVPEGFITEVIPVVCETKKYDPSVIQEIKKMKQLIDDL